MNDDDATGSACPACGGSGRTRRFRLMPILVALTALLFVVLGEMLLHALGIDPNSSRLDAGLLSCGIGVTILIFLGSLIAFFRRGYCSECQGRGTRGGLSSEVPFIWREDRIRLQQRKCRKCGYDLTGNVSGRCPECGTAVLQI